MSRRIEILSLGYADPPMGCEKARWWEIFRPFDARARYHAANLASHNWDILLIGERIFLFQVKYGGDRGHWLDQDGSREDASEAEMKELYIFRPGEPKRRKFHRSQAK